MPFDALPPTRPPDPWRRRLAGCVLAGAALSLASAWSLRALLGPGLLAALAGAAGFALALLPLARRGDAVAPAVQVEPILALPVAAPLPAPGHPVAEDVAAELDRYRLVAEILRR